MSERAVGSDIFFFADITVDWPQHFCFNGMIYKRGISTWNNFYTKELQSCPRNKMVGHQNEKSHVKTHTIRIIQPFTLEAWLISENRFNWRYKRG